MFPRHSELFTSVLFLLFLLVPLDCHCEQSYSVLSTEVSLSSDGVAQIRQTLGVDETDVSVSLILLSSSAQNMLVLDQANIPVSYEILGSDVSIITLGATRITLEYISSDLTKKEGSIWTFEANIPYEAVIVLPEQAQIMYLSDLPSSMFSGDNKTVLTVPPGRWEISYIQSSITTPITKTPASSSQVVTTTTTIASSPSSTTQAASSESPNATVFQLSYLVTGIVSVVAVVGVGAMYSRRKGKGTVATTDLKQEDKEVLRFISEKGGKVFESELRHEFVLPKSSLWRLAKKLERMGYVRISKVGIQNAVELVKRV